MRLNRNQFLLIAFYEIGWAVNSRQNDDLSPNFKIRSLSNKLSDLILKLGLRAYDLLGFFTTLNEQSEYMLRKIMLINKQ